MAAIVNDRDVLLQSAPTRDADPGAGKALILTASSPVFHVDSAGAPLPGSIDLKVQLVAVKAPVSWAVTGATGLIVASDKLSASIRYIDLTAETATVTATCIDSGVTFQQTQIVQKVKDGMSGKTTALVYAYKRAASMPGDTPGAVVFDFASASITSPVGDALANGWSKTIPAGGNALYVAVASAVGTGASDAIAGTEWAGAVQLAQNGPPGSNGTDGMNSATVFIYRRSAVASSPALPTGYAVYTFSTGDLSGLDNGWTRTVPSSGGKYLFVSQATAAANGSSDVIFPAEWAAATIMVQDGNNGTSGTDGANGQRGTVNIVASGSSWSDAVANNAISTNGYGLPQNRDMVTITNGASFTDTRVYVSGSWLTVTAYINGNLVVSGTIAAAAIAADTLTGQTYQTAPSGQRVVINAGGSNKLTAYNSSGSLIAEIGGTSAGGLYCVSGSGLNPTIFGNNTSASVSTLIGAVNGQSSGIVGVYGASMNSYGMRGYSANSIGVYGSSISASGVEGVRGECTNGSSHGVRGMAKFAASSSIAQGLIGAANGYDFYADGAGTNYGPFTGAHDVLWLNDDVVELGDIVIDVECLARSGWSNTLFRVARSSEPGQRGAVGVLSVLQGSLSASVPAAFTYELSYVVVDPELGDEMPRRTVSATYHTIKDNYQRGAANAVGEGQINVCGEAGAVAAGDLIITSSMPGKGMRQADDVVRNTTVARAREACIFDSPGDVRQIACIYLCG